MTWDGLEGRDLVCRFGYRRCLRCLLVAAVVTVALSSIATTVGLLLNDSTVVNVIISGADGRDMLAGSGREETRLRLG